MGYIVVYDNVRDACSRGKPSQYTPEEESAFEASDNIFRGCLTSVLAENLVDTYICLTTGKQMWDALEAQYGVLMLAASCTSWSNFWTTGWLKTVLWKNKLMKYIRWQKI